MPVTTQGSTMILAGDVGDIGFDDELHFTQLEVIEALARLGSRRRITVRLNSGGGLATEGVAIASAIQAHGGCDILIEGVAASAASIIACAGQHVSMSLGSILMLHEASTVTVGTAQAHEQVIRGLEALNASYASLYARRSGKPLDEVRALMREETWFTAEQAVAEGFADAVAGAEKQPVAFAYAKAYRHAPATLKAISPRARRSSSPPPAPMPAPAPVDPPRPAPPAPAVIDMDCPADPAEIAELCMAARQPEMTASLVREKASLTQVAMRIDAMASLRPMADMFAGSPGITPELRAHVLSGQLSVEQASDAILTALAEADMAIVIDSSRRTGNGSPDPRAMSMQNMKQLVARQFGPASK